jgi:glycosyltransferase involved in cell wall biosynthesis
LDKIDVTIATKNSEKTIEKCIRSIKKTIPYNNIIVIDDSTDSTPRIAQELGAKVYHCPAMLGEKRFLQAKYSSTEWIASIDSDIFVYSNWWNELSIHMAEKDVVAIHGWLEGTIKDMFPQYEYFTKYIAANDAKKGKSLSAIGNTLVKRSILLDCEDLLKDIHAGEDSIIGNHIQKLGLKHIKVEKITGMHHHEDPIGHMKYAFFRAGESCVINNGKIKCIIFLLVPIVTTGLSWIDYSINTKKFDIELFYFLMKMQGYRIKGVMSKL